MSAVMNTMVSQPAKPVAETPPRAVEVAKPAATEPVRQAATGPEAVKTSVSGAAMRAFLLAALPPVLGLALLVLVWELVAMKSSGIPSPLVTFTEAVKVFSDPFYQKGPNDQGI